MAFLDNSGDIILDAVLTDTGRKRMAAGNFSITKFAIGDDEIDYTLYNKDHPSGSAYYDLEILQTPVLEAFTQINANINYGLLSYARQDLLYLPSIELNQKMSSAVRKSSLGPIYLADNGATNSDSKTTTELLKVSRGSDESILNGTNPNTNKIILIETGINDPTGPIGSSTNQSNFILSVGLADPNFNVQYDSTLISEVLGPDADASFSNTTGTGEASLKLTGFASEGSEGTSNQVPQYSVASVKGLLNRVYHNSSKGGVDTALNFSAVAGPRASFTCLAFKINDGITNEDYLVKGLTAQTQGDATLYDFIDTNIYVNGTSTNVSLQIPIRIIRVRS